MQRQAVPTLRPDRACRQNGYGAADGPRSGAVIIARRSGIVTRVTAEQRGRHHDDGRRGQLPADLNLLRSNNSTCITQRPIVNKGQRVRQGQVLNGWPCTDLANWRSSERPGGVYALGGYNYEDGSCSPSGWSRMMCLLRSISKSSTRRPATPNSARRDHPRHSQCRRGYAQRPG